MRTNRFSIALLTFFAIEFLSLSPISFLPLSPTIAQFPELNFETNNRLPFPNYRAQMPPNFVNTPRISLTCTI